MKTTQYSTIVGSNPVWLHDASSLFNYVVNGARIKPSTITGDTLRSGSLVGRTANQKQWTVIPPTATKSSGNYLTKNSTTLTSAIAIGATSFVVDNIDGFLVGNAVTVGANALTILAVNNQTNTFTTTTAASAAAAAGATVELTTAVPFVETFLVATEITNKADNNEATLLRHGRAIYINFLPGYSTFSADVKATVQSLYQSTDGLL